ncbi:TRAP transporter small permease subunit [Roseibaca sp. Y0-43]|uniref:TRAP transporter small permease subunit n=1 Tax=Roseibaca sp. Y0-43 TaxID=2816854 RepID=UPI001D0C932F|nr:TRAP transporter small permease subunit [Roseibaca sp. Y0-43]MCC1482064.1 TRAP transporter small permease subunit [Roseibaca sp. Y0-43]
MPRVLISFVHMVEALNYRVGRLAMWSLFALMGVLAWGAIARAGFTPQIWTDEMAQFLLLGYFILGGAYSLQMGSAVRMDLLYSRWSDKTKAAVDAITIFTLLIYLGVLLWGGIESTQFALEYAERRRGLWRPYMAPIKIVMCIGIVLMILQCTAFLIRDIAKLRGITIKERAV